MMLIDKRRKPRHCDCMTRKPVKTAEQAIEILGGKEFVGGWWGVGRTGVLDMIRRNRISAGHRLHAYIELRKRGYEPSPQVFGLRSWDNLKPPPGLRRHVKRATPKTNGVTAPHP